MVQHQETVEFITRGRSLQDITARVQTFLRKMSVEQGLLTLFLQHTSASLLIQENADPDVLGDLERFFSRWVKDGDPLYHHSAEGPDDMPAHIRTALTSSQLSIPVDAGRLMLGTWQAVYLYEHRHRGQTRSLVLHYMGS